MRGRGLKMAPVVFRRWRGEGQDHARSSGVHSRLGSGCRCRCRCANRRCRESCKAASRGGGAHKPSLAFEVSQCGMRKRANQLPCSSSVPPAGKWPNLHRSPCRRPIPAHRLGGARGISCPGHGDPAPCRDRNLERPDRKSPTKSPGSPRHRHGPIARDSPDS